MSNKAGTRRRRASAGSSPRASRVSPRVVRETLAALGDASWSELTRHLGLRRGPESRNLRRTLEGLVASGDVEVSRNGRYSLADESSDSESGSKVPFDVIGRVAGHGRAWFVEPVGADFKERIDLVAKPQASRGAIVEVEVVGVSADGWKGRVKRLVESGGEAARAAEAMLAAHRIPRTWPFDPKKLNVPSSVPADAVRSRQDLRKLPLVTIDGADARDFDDAVYAEPRRGGGWRLVVAIADVAHYVKTGSALDREARERGNSLYLPDRVIPMLPEALSNGICSLVPRQDRLAMVCDMRVSRRGQVSGHQFHEAVIRSHARLTYTKVGEFLDGGKLEVDRAVAASLRALHDVYGALRDRRDERGALDLDTPELTVVLNKGMPTGVQPVVRNDAHRLVEEAMIAANVAAAQHLERRKSAGRSVPPVYRVHEPPPADKRDALATALRLVGQSLPSGVVEPAQLAEVVRQAQAKSTWPAWIWDALVLRSLAQARYEPRRLGHFGLALPSYAHFTSPIRRYADLLVHRMIKGQEVSLDELDAASAHISMTERRAEDVERAVDAWLKCVLAERHVGETFAGTVAAVVEFGLFVEIDGLHVQGLVHISKLGRDYYHYVPESMSLVAERSGTRFALADRLDVVIEEVSVVTGRIDLVLASRARHGGGRRRRRR